MHQHDSSNSWSVHSTFAIRGDLDGAKDASDFENLEQFIGLVIGKDEFLLPINVMNEINMLNQITFVPGAPQYVEGVINLRGTIIPAVNLRKLMGLPTVPPTPSSRIIIASYENVTVGLIVDGITYVVSLRQDQIENQSLPTKSFGKDLLQAIAKRDQQVCGILDIYKTIMEACDGTLPSGQEEGEEGDAA